MAWATVGVASSSVWYHFYRCILRIAHLNRLFTCGLFLILVYGIQRSCSGNKSAKNLPESAFIACVGKRYLYLSDLEPIGLLQIDGEEREFFIKKYAEEWACKQLLIAQATQQSSELSLEAKLNDYKHDLLAYHFLETLIEAELDPNVSSAEIAAYYKEHKQRDFILHHDIVRGIFLALPKKAACINSIRSLLLSTKAEDQKKLQTYCKPYADTTILHPDKWFPWESVLARIGYPSIRDVTRLLKSNKFIHIAGKKYIYFLKINQYKVAQEVAPLEAVEDRIKAIILHKRKLALIHTIKYKLLEDAKKNNICSIQIN